MDSIETSGPLGGMDPVEQIYREDHARLWRALVAYTGDPDLATEAEAETLSQALGRGSELRDPRAWIWRSAFKVAAGLMAERRQRATPLDLDQAEEVDSSELRFDQLDHPLVEFLELLETLSPQQRSVVILRYVGGFRPTEIAGLLSTTPTTIRVQLHRAHRHLRERIER